MVMDILLRHPDKVRSRPVRPFGAQSSSLQLEFLNVCWSTGYDILVTQAGSLHELRVFVKW